MMRRDPNATCKNCPYRDDLYCHKDPPVVLDDGTYWPYVTLDSWCGEHPEFWKRPSEPGDPDQWREME